MYVQMQGTDAGWEDGAQLVYKAFTGQPQLAKDYFLKPQWTGACNRAADFGVMKGGDHRCR